MAYNGIGDCLLTVSQFYREQRRGRSIAVTAMENRWNLWNDMLSRKRQSIIDIFVSIMQRADFRAKKITRAAGFTSGFATRPLARRRSTELTLWRSLCVHSVNPCYFGRNGIDRADRRVFTRETSGVNEKWKIKMGRGERYPRVKRKYFFASSRQRDELDMFIPARQYGPCVRLLYTRFFFFWFRDRKCGRGNIFFRSREARSKNGRPRSFDRCTRVLRAYLIFFAFSLFFFLAKNGDEVDRGENEEQRYAIEET